MAKNVLIINFDKCTGCRLCESICSFVKERSVINPSKARVKVSKNEEKGIDVPVMCINCEEPPCASACPVEAIEKDSTTGVVVNQDKCNGCMKCVEACPYGAMFFDPEKKVAYNCDLCGGDPACIKICGSRVPPPGLANIESVIKYVPTDSLREGELKEFIEKYQSVIKKAQKNCR